MLRSGWGQGMQFGQLRRRKFITLLGDAVAWPFVAHAQQPLLPVIGFLSSLGKGDRPNLREGFRRGLSESGYVEGHNVSIEYRFAENQPDRLPALAAELVDRKVAVIAATGGGGSILAAKAATTTIPIVFTYGGDPVREGFVASLNRSGGNVRGASFFSVSSAWHLHQPDRSAGGKGAVGARHREGCVKSELFQSSAAAGPL
jgi:putative tryptophan/tyrosine transport system substrate-binding protein